MSQSSAILSLKNVSKTYRTDEMETAAINDVSIDISDGEFVAIVGRSGSGKSTLLSVMGLLEKPSSGEYEIDNVPTSRLTPAQSAQLRNRHLGYVFQSYNLISHMVVLENVLLPLAYRKGGAKSSEDKALELLDRLGIAHRQRHYPAQLSGGEQQRTAIARALIGNPSVILADEPTGNLDSDNANIILDILTDLHERGTTICMVTHNPQEAERASRVLNMSDGRALPAP